MMLPVWIISTRAKLAENQLDSSNMVPAQWQSMYWCRHSGWQHPVAYSQRTCSRNVITQPVPSSPSTGKYVTFKSACLTLVPTKSMRWKWGDGDDAATAFSSNTCAISFYELCLLIPSYAVNFYPKIIYNVLFCWFCHFGLVMFANCK